MGIAYDKRWWVIARRRLPLACGGGFSAAQRCGATAIMACCFGLRRRLRDTEHDVYLYPAPPGGEVLLQYGGELRPELVYGGDSAAPTRAGAGEGIGTRQLDEVAPTFRCTPKEVGAECAICLETLAKGEEIRRLPRCGHTFRSECIRQWLTNSTVCPTCMQPALPEGHVVQPTASAASSSHSVETRVVRVHSYRRGRRVHLTPSGYATTLPHLRR